MAGVLNNSATQLNSWKETKNRVLQTFLYRMTNELVQDAPKGATYIPWSSLLMGWGAGACSGCTFVVSSRGGGRIVRAWDKGRVVPWRMKKQIET